ncbi:hypothetical protein V7S43_001800 [Phytophthora oleae]|uniref:Uncharacterized protein n=1 Tax=Phytophthora oleae TaxID=2107226 RepID=A0ABD3G3E4_9STRA
MRVAYALQGLLAASTTIAASFNPQYIVLGTDGTVVVDADPSLYFRTGKNQLYEDHDQLEDVVSCDLTPKQTEVDELPIVLLPSIHDELLAAHDVASDQETDEDDFSSTAPPDLVLPTSWTVTEESETPGVYGSVIFAELSCCFVAFVGYLVTSIPLWVGFSRGQKCCIVVAFILAILYQFAAVGWIVGVVTPEFMLGLSSLITRMISLGMVPITTTSFMCRAREICQDHAAVASTGRKSSHSRSSRRHHARARAS